MVSRKQEPDAGVTTGGGGNSAGAPQTQHTQGGGLGAEDERREQGGGSGGHGIPESLRVGTPGGAASTNPFVRAQHTGNPSASGPEAVVNPWAGEEEKGRPDVGVPDANVPDANAPGASAPNAGVPLASSQHQGEVPWGSTIV